jgi:hypothetical protein
LVLRIGAFLAAAGSGKFERSQEKFRGRGV